MTAQHVEKIILIDTKRRFQINIKL